MIKKIGNNSTIKAITAQETWPLRKEVMWPDHPLEFVKIEGDIKAKHFGLFIDNELISIISLFEKEEKVQFRKFATKQVFQGKGLGTQLLSFVIEEVKDSGKKSLFCNARKDKTSFYKRFGMKCTNQTFHRAGIDYVIMERTF